MLKNTYTRGIVESQGLASLKVNVFRWISNYDQDKKQIKVFMTSLIAWVGIDPRGQSSAYIASDSRFSWDKKDTWDIGQKLFAASNFPEIFGYCGDVTFPSQILMDCINQIEQNLLIYKGDSVAEKANKIYLHIQKAFEYYPAKHKKGFEILYFTRDNCGMQTQFYLHKIKWGIKSDFELEKIDLPEQSGLVDYTGSGKHSIFQWYRRWQNTEIKGTSRAVFNAFCDSLNSGEDPLTGGAPQLVGLYRKGYGRSFGVIQDSKRYFYGKLIEQMTNINNIEWRNCLFERCDGQSMKILPKAQRQPKPSKLN